MASNAAGFRAAEASSLQQDTPAALNRRELLGMAVASALVVGSTPVSAARVQHRDIKVAGGVVRGVASPTPGVTAWLGIPYAAPPVGALRWRPPQPVQPWTQTLVADRFSKSPWAPRMPRSSIFVRNAVEMDEDCLTVNVWTPQNAANRKLPVMVWIYGGAFVWGTSDDDSYHGDRMAADDVVFVSFNYRVGILGFFAHPQLSAESADGVSGNYGLLDQIAALKWVQNNIAAFGGDPDNVTIFGQSAGAFSVGFHLVMPDSRQLFHKGIVQSGAPLGTPSSMILLGDLQSVEKSGIDLAAEVGASDLSELRKMPPDVLVEANNKTWRFYPVIDGKVLPDHPYSLMERGLHRDVPLIAGFNHNEGGVFPLLGGGTPAGLKQAIQAFYGSEALAAEPYFRAASDAEAVLQDHQLFADVVFNWNTAALAVLQVKHSKSPVYFYHFDQAPGFQQGRVFDEGAADALGAYHGAEIEYALRTIPQRSNRNDRALSRVVSGYWLNFARHGDPNGPGLTRWSPLQTVKRDVLRIRAAGCSASSLAFEERLKVLGRAMGRPVLEAG